MPSLGVQLQPGPERGSYPLGHPGSPSLSPSGGALGRPGLPLPFCLNVSLQLPFPQDLHAGGQSEPVQPGGGGCAPACCPQGSAPPRAMTSCAHVWPIFCFKLSTVGCFFPSGMFSSPVSLRCLFSFISYLFRCLLVVSSSCPFPFPFLCIPQMCLLFLTGF